MSNKLKISLPNKGMWEKEEYKKVTSDFKKENWKTSDATKKKLKKYRNNPRNILERFRKVHRKKYDYSKIEFRYKSFPIIIICSEHGEFKQTLTKHLNGSNCPMC